MESNHIITKLLSENEEFANKYQELKETYPALLWMVDYPFDDDDMEAFCWKNDQYVRYFRSYRDIKKPHYQPENWKVMMTVPSKQGGSLIWSLRQVIRREQLIIRV